MYSVLLEYRVSFIQLLVPIFITQQFFSTPAWIRSPHKIHGYGNLHKVGINLLYTWSSESILIYSIDKWCYSFLLRGNCIFKTLSVSALLLRHSFLHVSLFPFLITRSLVFLSSTYSNIQDAPQRELIHEEQQMLKS